MYNFTELNKEGEGDFDVSKACKHIKPIIEAASGWSSSIEQGAKTSSVSGYGPYNESGRTPVQDMGLQGQHDAPYIGRGYQNKTGTIGYNLFVKWNGIRLGTPAKVEKMMRRDDWSDYPEPLLMPDSDSGWSEHSHPDKAYVWPPGDAGLVHYPLVKTTGDTKWRYNGKTKTLIKRISKELLRDGSYRMNNVFDDNDGNHYCYLNNVRSLSTTVNYYTCTDVQSKGIGDEKVIYEDYKCLQCILEELGMDKLPTQQK